MTDHKLNIGNKGKKIDAHNPTSFLREPPWTDQRPVEHDHHAREIGIVHGVKGFVDAEVLQGPYRSAYIAGYRNGAWIRYSRRDWHAEQPEGMAFAGWDLNNKLKHHYHDMIYMPRYPHEPVIWYA